MLKEKWAPVEKTPIREQKGNVSSRRSVGRGAAASASAAEGTDWAAERGAVPSGGRGGRSWPSHLSDKGFASRYGDSNFVNKKIRVHF